MTSNLDRFKDLLGPDSNYSVKSVEIKKDAAIVRLAFNQGKKELRVILNNSTVVNYLKTGHNKEQAADWLKERGKVLQQAAKSENRISLSNKQIRIGRTTFTIQELKNHPSEEFVENRKAELLTSKKELQEQIKQIEKEMSPMTWEESLGLRPLNAQLIKIDAELKLLTSMSIAANLVGLAKDTLNSEVSEKKIPVKSEKNIKECFLYKSSSKLDLEGLSSRQISEIPFNDVAFGKDHMEAIDWTPIKASHVPIKAFVAREAKAFAPREASLSQSELGKRLTILLSKLENISRIPWTDLASDERKKLLLSLDFDSLDHAKILQILQNADPFQIDLLKKILPTMDLDSLLEEMNNPNTINTHFNSLLSRCSKKEKQELYQLLPLNKVSGKNISLLFSSLENPKALRESFIKTQHAEFARLFKHGKTEDLNALLSRWNTLEKSDLNQLLEKFKLQLTHEQVEKLLHRDNFENLNQTITTALLKDSNFDLAKCNEQQRHLFLDKISDPMPKQLVKFELEESLSAYKENDMEKLREILIRWNNLDQQSLFKLLNNFEVKLSHRQVTALLDLNLNDIRKEIIQVLLKKANYDLNQFEGAHVSHLFELLNNTTAIRDKYIHSQKEQLLTALKKNDIGINHLLSNWDTLAERDVDELLTGIQLTQDSLKWLFDSTSFKELNPTLQKALVKSTPYNLNQPQSTIKHALLYLNARGDAELKQQYIQNLQAEFKDVLKIDQSMTASASILKNWNELDEATLVELLNGFTVDLRSEQLEKLSYKIDINHLQSPLFALISQKKLQDIEQSSNQLSLYLEQSNYKAAVDMLLQWNEFSPNDLSLHLRPFNLYLSHHQVEGLLANESFQNLNPQIKNTLLEHSNYDLNNTSTKNRKLFLASIEDKHPIQLLRTEDDNLKYFFKTHQMDRVCGILAKNWKDLDPQKVSEIIASFDINLSTNDIEALLQNKMFQKLDATIKDALLPESQKIEFFKNELKSDIAEKIINYWDSFDKSDMELIPPLSHNQVVTLLAQNPKDSTILNVLLKKANYDPNLVSGDQASLFLSLVGDPTIRSTYFKSQNNDFQSALTDKNLEKTQLMLNNWNTLHEDDMKFLLRDSKFKQEDLGWLLDSTNFQDLKLPLKEMIVNNTTYDPTLLRVGHAPLFFSLLKNPLEPKLEYFDSQNTKFQSLLAAKDIEESQLMLNNWNTLQTNDMAFLNNVKLSQDDLTWLFDSTTFKDLNPILQNGLVKNATYDTKKSTFKHAFLYLNALDHSETKDKYIEQQKENLQNRFPNPAISKETKTLSIEALDIEQLLSGTDTQLALEQFQMLLDFIEVNQLSPHFINAFVSNFAEIRNNSNTLLSYLQKNNFDLAFGMLLQWQKFDENTLDLHLMLLNPHLSHSQVESLFEQGIPQNLNNKKITTALFQKSDYDLNHVSKEHRELFLQSIEDPQPLQLLQAEDKQMQDAFKSHDMNKVCEILNDWKNLNPKKVSDIIASSKVNLDVNDILVLLQNQLFQKLDATVQNALLPQSDELKTAPYDLTKSNPNNISFYFKYVKGPTPSKTEYIESEQGKLLNAVKEGVIQIDFVFRRWENLSQEVVFEFLKGVQFQLAQNQLKVLKGRKIGHAFIYIAALEPSNGMIAKDYYIQYQQRQLQRVLSSKSPDALSGILSEWKTLDLLHFSELLNGLDPKIISLIMEKSQIIAHERMRFIEAINQLRPQVKKGNLIFNSKEFEVVSDIIESWNKLNPFFIDLLTKNFELNLTQLQCEQLFRLNLDHLNKSIRDVLIKSTAKQLAKVLPEFFKPLSSSILDQGRGDFIQEKIRNEISTNNNIAFESDVIRGHTFQFDDQLKNSNNILYPQSFKQASEKKPHTIRQSKAIIKSHIVHWNDDPWELIFQSLINQTIFNNAFADYRTVLFEYLTVSWMEEDKDHRMIMGFNTHQGLFDPIKILLTRDASNRITQAIISVDTSLNIVDATTDEEGREVETPLIDNAINTSVSFSVHLDQENLPVISDFKTSYSFEKSSS